ncbi:MAG: MBL fold metallo-hydrolase, partial [Bacteroidales bacterium]|nr:MBL fold metallo-hydrolase [Bacteroidales bacterium]
GASGLFAVNAARMGIDLSDVDYVFLSHGHSDHVGGLKTFLDLNSKAKVIVSPDAVSGRFYSGRGGLHSISCDWPLSQMQGRTIAVTDTMTLADGMQVIARIPQRHPLPSGNRLLTVRREGGLVPDDFSHEMACYVDGLLYTGCAHNGLENILDACYPQVSFLTGHCTGNGAFRILQSVMGSRLRQFACGMQIDMK